MIGPFLMTSGLRLVFSETEPIPSALHTIWFIVIFILLGVHFWYPDRRLHCSRYPRPVDPVLFCARAPLHEALEVVLEVVESQLELDLGIGVGPVLAIGLLQGSQLWVQLWRTGLVTHYHVWA